MELLKLCDPYQFSILLLMSHVSDKDLTQVQNKPTYPHFSTLSFTLAPYSNHKIECVELRDQNFNSWRPARQVAQRHWSKAMAIGATWWWLNLRNIASVAGQLWPRCCAMWLELHNIVFATLLVCCATWIERVLFDKRKCVYFVCILSNLFLVCLKCDCGWMLVYLSFNICLSFAFSFGWFLSLSKIKNVT